MRCVTFLSNNAQRTCCQWLWLAYVLCTKPTAACLPIHTDQHSCRAGRNYQTATLHILAWSQGAAFSRPIGDRHYPWISSVCPSHPCELRGVKERDGSWCWVGGADC
ncbi:hypothetical protein BJX68DRAFT_242871 [Aspergillus pseudodeflectus]|uniref:Secreted protein n=1 Tax=Aspergillus pseudodeflectus TaxID=176178 RepID=A0ABR4JXC2_9EURO